MDRPGTRTSRRQLLGLLGAAALAGCSGRGDGDRDADGGSTLTAVALPESTATARERQVRSPDPEGGRVFPGPWYERTSTTTLSPPGLRVAFHPRPTGLPGLVGGGRFVRRGTRESPARLDLELVNTGSDPVPIPYEPVRGRLVTPRGDARAYLLPVPPAEGGTDERSPRDQFRLEGYWRGRPRSDRERGTTLAPGDLETLGYLLVADPAGPALPVGTYGFETALGWSFTLGVWLDGEPGPRRTSRFAGTDVPGLPLDGRTAWFHGADRTTAVYLRPSAERVSLADGSTVLRLAQFNHSDGALVGNPLAYGFLKLHEGVWYHVVPEQLPAPTGTLPQGATLEKRFALSHGAHEERDDLVPVGHLGGGRYAVRFGMHRPGDVTQHAAMFDLAAPELDLSPAPGLRVSGRDSSHPLAWLDPNDRLFDAIVSVTRTDEPADRTVIAEEVMHDPVLRNTLSLFDAHTETVELHTRDHIADRSLRTGVVLRVSFRGTTYELTRRDD